eukprot:gene4212-5986_t
MDSNEILKLIEKSPYEKSIIPVLESYVGYQLHNQTYDFAANKALLKNYQAHYDLINERMVSNILILSMMRLPSSDLLSLMYLIPTKAITDTKIATIQKSYDFLQRGQFREFWVKFMESQELFTEATGFVDSIRLFILGNLRDTFKTIPNELFQQQLGLDAQNLIAFCDSNKYVENVTADKIIFAPNDENQNKSVQLEETLRLDEALRLVEKLRK